MGGTSPRPRAPLPPLPADDFAVVGERLVPLCQRLVGRSSTSSGGHVLWLKFQNFCVVGRRIVPLAQARITESPIGPNDGVLGAAGNVEGFRVIGDGLFALTE